MKLVKTKVALDVIDVSRQTLARCIASGEIPGLKVGGHWFVDLDALSQKVKKRRVS